MPGKRSPQRPQITIIGSGRLGTALAVALNRKRYPIEALVAAHLRSAKKAAGYLDVPVVALAAKDIGSLVPGGVVIIATPDDQIGTAVDRLLALPKGKDRVVLHVSGALSSSILSALAAKNWRIGSLHPLVSVSDPIVGAESLEGAYWSVEGDPKAVRVSKSIVKDLNGRAFSVKSDKKTLYHAAAVMASGNVVALFDVALDMMNRSGLSRAEAQQVLLPLLESTVRNLSRSTPSESLTGTFSRADVKTVERHLEALSDRQLQLARDLYKLLGTRSASLAMGRGVNRQSLERITELLKS